MPRHPLMAARFLPLLLVLSTSACSGDTSASATSRAATSPASQPNDITFESTTVTLKGKAFTLEIADTDIKEARGLMYRETMAPDHGMLFVFPMPTDSGFWMKNTLIPLDIIFIDSGGRVLNIHHRKPLDETGMGPDAPALFVIELNSGTANAIGLKVGDTISLPEKYLKTTPASTEKKP